MNQILDKNNNYIFNEIKEKNKFKQYLKNNKYKLQFITSLSVAIIFYFVFSINLIKSNYQEKISKKLLNNYNLTTLYQENTLNNLLKTQEEPFVIGIIKIDKIDLNYPVLSQTNNDLLKISLCRFVGPMPNKIGNLCIVGHNYIDNRFFGRLNELVKRRYF